MARDEAEDILKDWADKARRQWDEYERYTLPDRDVSELTRFDLSLNIPASEFVFWLNRKVTIFGLRTVNGSAVLEPHELAAQEQSDGTTIINIRRVFGFEDESDWAPEIQLTVLSMGAAGCVVESECYQADSWDCYINLLLEIAGLFGRDPTQKELLAEFGNELDDCLRDRVAVDQAIVFFGEQVVFSGEDCMYDDYLKLKRAARHFGDGVPDFKEYLVAMWRLEEQDEPWAEQWEQPQPHSVTEAIPAQSIVDGPECHTSDELDYLAVIVNGIDREAVRKWNHEDATEADLAKHWSISSTSAHRKIISLRKRYTSTVVHYKRHRDTPR